MVDTGRRFAVEDVPVGSSGRNLAEDSFEGREGNGDADVPLRMNPKADLVSCGGKVSSLGNSVSR